jgi:hypothetical protein
VDGPIGSSALLTPRKKWRIGADTTTKNALMGQRQQTADFAENNVGASSPPA